MISASWPWLRASRPWRVASGTPSVPEIPDPAAERSGVDPSHLNGRQVRDRLVGLLPGDPPSQLPAPQAGHDLEVGEIERHPPAPGLEPGMDLGGDGRRPISSLTTTAEIPGATEIVPG